MSESDSNELEESANESTRLMDGHVATSRADTSGAAGSVGNGNRSGGKRKSKSTTNNVNYGAVSCYY